MMGLESPMAHQRAIEVGTAMVRSVVRASEMLGQLQASCTLALEQQCEPITGLVNQTLESHAAGLLPLAQAIAVVTSELRAVDLTLNRELRHLRSRCPASMPPTAVLGQLLRASASQDPTNDTFDGSSSNGVGGSGGTHGTDNKSPADDGGDVASDPLKSPHAVAVRDTQTRCDVLTAVINNARNAILQIPPALSGLVRTTAQPATLRPGNNYNSSSSGRFISNGRSGRDAGDDDRYVEPNLKETVDMEVSSLRATLEEALASLHKHRAAVRASDALAAIENAADDSPTAKLHMHQVTPVSIRRRLDEIIAQELSPMHHSRLNTAGAGKDSPRRQVGLSCDQAGAVAVIRAILQFFTSVERRILTLAADRFAEEASDNELREQL